MLKIVADNAIPFVERYFSCIGELEFVDGRRISAADLKDADVLVCRTVTRVDRHLLESSAIKIVASPTSGTDHIDHEFLQARSIQCVSAPGSNARSVAEYVLSAVCVLADQGGLDLSSKRIGIVGCGHVGSRVREFFETVGIECLVYDPLLRQAGAAGTYCELDDIRRTDIITLHVPLTLTGQFPTSMMLDREFIDTLSSDVIVVNTARGGVLDEKALKTFLADNPQARAVVDVWMNEPLIDPAMLLAADIGTPHIAGYSMDGKLRATRSVFEQVCKCLGIEADSEGLTQAGLDERRRQISLSQYRDDIDAVSLAVLAAYDVRSDAAALRRMLESDVKDRGSYFAELRNNYPIRREFSSLLITLPKEAATLRRKLLTLGFQISSQAGPE